MVVRPKCGYIQGNDSTRLDLQLHPMQVEDHNAVLKDKLLIEVIEINSE